MTDGGRGGLRIGQNRDRVEADAAVPDRRETAGAEDFPAMRIGDVQRQTAICIMLRRAVHPIALQRRRTDAELATFDQVTGELHDRTVSQNPCSSVVSAVCGRQTIARLRAAADTFALTW